MKFSTTALLAAALGSTATHAFTGSMRYFYPNLGSCGKVNKSTQPVVALSPLVMKNGPNPNTNPICGETITIKYNGTTAKGKIVDTCGGCARGDILVSPALFEKFAPLGQEIVSGITWKINP